MKRRTITMQMRFITAFAALLFCTLQADAAVRGAIHKTDGGEPIQGDIRWFGATQEFDVATPQYNIKVPLAQVARVVVPEPPQFKAAVQAVQTKAFAGAIGPLEKIVSEYEMMEWDVKAARWLAEAYLGMAQYPQARDMCEKLIRANPEAAKSGDLARVYWDVLEKMKLEAKLTSVLTDAIKTGSREVAAVAQLKRADIERAKGNARKALVEGYLRTAILYGDVRSVQPEALYKAAESFQQLGMQSDAEKMRKRLLEHFPTSPEAQKVRAGA